MRKLRAEEIDCRPKQIYEDKCMLLLYKDARCDMRIMDETFGPEYWSRSHEVINDNLYCTVSVWSESTGQWVSKQDVGIESQTEKEKGEASDAFKRACVNWGIGRELYTAPNIWIKLNKGETRQGKSGPQLAWGLRFHVSHIAYSEAGDIVELVISDSAGKERFKFGVKGGKTEKDLQQEVKESTELQRTKERYLEGLALYGGSVKLLNEELYLLDAETDEERKKAVADIFEKADPAELDGLTAQLISLIEKAEESE